MMDSFNEGSKCSSTRDVYNWMMKVTRQLEKENNQKTNLNIKNHETNNKDFFKFYN